MPNKKQQAKKMASKGATVKEIRKATGVSREVAKKFTSPPSGGGGDPAIGPSRAARLAFAASNPTARLTGNDKRQVKQAVKQAAAAREKPIYQGAGFQDAIQNQAAGGTVGQQFYDSLDAGVRGDLSPQQVAKYVMSQGYGLGDQWQKDFGTKTKSAQTLKEAVKGDSKMRLGDLLKIATGQGKGTDFVSNKEFRKIYNYFDGNKDGLKITNRMDKINAKQADKKNGYNPMGLQVGTLGKINKGKYGDARDIAWNNMTNLAFGTTGPMRDAFTKLDGKSGGPLSQLALNYKGSNIEDMKGKNGVYGVDTDGNAIFSPGQGGKSWSKNKINKSTTSTYLPWAPDVKPVIPDEVPVIPEAGPVIPENQEPIPPEEAIDRSASSGAGGLDIDSWVNSYKQARSARQKSGPSAQGLGSKKKNPFKSWA